MEIKQVIEIKTQDGFMLFGTKIDGKRTLFDSAAKKVALLYNLSRQRNPYALLYLMQLKSEVDKLTAELESQLKTTKRLIKKHAGEIPKVRFQNKNKNNKKQVSFSNPVHFGLINIVVLYDNSVQHLMLARSMGVFKNKNGFYKVKDRQKKAILRFFSKTMQVKTKDLPNLSIAHYLENDPLYQKASATFGDINPQALYNAIRSPVTPSMDAEFLNRTIKKLKEIVLEKS